MKKTLMISAAAAALVLTTGLAGAQGPAGGSQGAAPSTPAAAPPAASGQPSGSAMSRGERPSASDNTKSEGQKSSQSGDRMKPEGAQPNQRAQDATPDAKQPNTTKADTPSKSAPNTAAQDQKAEPKTTGQAGAGAKISTEQRTQIRTVIKQQNVKPTTNINFSISVGTRVPRAGVSFYPLPAQIISIYPDWRGYEYFLVRDEIIVVNPRTLEIVAVLEA